MTMSTKTKTTEGPKGVVPGVLEEVAEFLRDQEDIKDGSDGVPQPNRAMTLLQDLEVLIERFKHQPPELESDQFVEIGTLHRTRSGDVHFLQDVESIPLPLHGLLTVYIKSDKQGK